MSKLPGRKTRKWKGKIRRNNENRERLPENDPVFNDQTLSSRYGPAEKGGGAIADAVGGSRSSHPGYNDGQHWRGSERDAVDGRYSAAGGATPSKGLHQGADSLIRSGSGQGEAVAAIQENERLNPGRKPQGKKRKSGRRIADVPDQLARSFRAPVTPVPDAVYSPIKGRDGGQGKTATRQKPGEQYRHTKPSQNLEARDDQPNAQEKRRFGNGSAGGTNKKYRSGQALYAALDLGTNNCRLLVAVPQERGRFRVIDGFSKIVRLGEGLGHNGSLSDAAMEQGNGSVADMRRETCQPQYPTPSSDCDGSLPAGRRMVKLFLDRVKTETGMDLEIIDRQTEAYLAAEGCGALMDRKADAAVLFDIGGGSSELGAGEPEDQAESASPTRLSLGHRCRSGLSPLQNVMAGKRSIRMCFAT